MNLHPRFGSSDSNSQRGSNNPRMKRSAENADNSVRTESKQTRSSQDSTRLTSVRIGDIDTAQRSSGRTSRFSRVIFIIIGVLIVVILAISISLIVLSRTSVIEIDNIEVVGNDHLTTDEISQLVTVPQGTTLFDVDVDSIASSLERDAWVQSVEVNRVFPSTLKIDITERKIVAIVEVPMDTAQTIQSWAISSDGVWLMAIPSRDSEIGQSISEQIYEDAANVLWITDVPYGVTPVIGAYCTDSNINNALAIVSGMTTELVEQVKTVSATDAESTLLTLDSGIEIAFGVAKDIRDKERVCLEIIEENPTVVYINVRVVDRPTWRAV